MRPGRRPNSWDRLLLRGWFQLLGIDLRYSSILEIGSDALPSRDPTLGYDRFALLTLLWGGACCICELLWLALWAGLRGVNAIPHDVFLPGFLFIAGFSIAGMVDSLWRMWLMWAAKQKKQRDRDVTDTSGFRLMRLAEMNDATLLLQVVVGVALAIAAS